MLTRLIDEEVSTGIPNGHRYFKLMFLTEMRRVLESPIFQVGWSSVARNTLISSRRMVWYA